MTKCELLTEWLASANETFTVLYSEVKGVHTGGFVEAMTKPELLSMLEGVEYQKNGNMYVGDNLDMCLGLDLKRPFFEGFTKVHSIYIFKRDVVVLE